MTWQTNHQKWKRFTGLDLELHKQLTGLENDAKQLEYYGQGNVPTLTCF